MSAKQVLHPRNEPIREVFFPNGGVASVTTVMRDGAMVEIATIGDEGLVGMDAFFGATVMSGETMVQVPDTNAEAMSVKAFRTELDRRGPFYDGVQLYSQGLMILMMQSTACMALHPVRSGVPLAIDDTRSCAAGRVSPQPRVPGDDAGLDAADRQRRRGDAAESGLIRYLHGHITILDRPGLEAASCECYDTVRAHFERLGL